MLSEASEAVALALWSALRVVQLWSATPRSRRHLLFRPVNQHVRERLRAAALAAPELSDALESLGSVQEAPGAAEPHRIAAACHHVYAWADFRSLARTATLFAEAAAYAEPDHPTWAVDAAWSCRRSGGAEMIGRSEAWYLRAFRLAVRTQNRKESIRALNGFGALMQDHGRYEEAHRAYTLAMRRALRTGRLRQAAVAHHYLFGLAVEVGSVEDAAEHAREALDLYPLTDERLPYLAHDLGFLLVRKGFYRAALRLLEIAATRMDRPDEMGLMFGTTARAAGGVGRVSRYEAAERAALELIGRREDYAAGSLVHLAEGARLLGDWDRAERYAADALAIARRRHEADIEAVAVQLVAEIASRAAVVPPKVLESDHPLAALCRRLGARLRKRARKRKVR